MTATLIRGPWHAQSADDRAIVVAFLRLWPRLSFLPDAWIVRLLQSEGITASMLKRVKAALHRRNT